MPITNPSSSSGGAAIDLGPLTAWIILAADGGNDTTGEVGNPAKPYATLAGAKADGATVFHFGVGTFAGTAWNVDSGGFSLSMFGAGIGQTIVGTLTFNRTIVGSAPSVVIASDLSITHGDITSFGQTGAIGASGADAGSGTEEAGEAGAIGGEGTPSPALVLYNIKCGAISSIAGNGGAGGGGGNGDGGATGGNGGNGGLGGDAGGVQTFNCFHDAITIMAGGGGAAGDAGQSPTPGTAGDMGDGGSTGDLTAKFCSGESHLLSEGVGTSNGIRGGVFLQACVYTGACSGRQSGDLIVMSSENTTFTDYEATP